MSETRADLVLRIGDLREQRAELRAALLAAVRERDEARAQIEALTAVHWRYFDDEGDPGVDDTTPAPEDVWRYDRDFRAALAAPAPREEPWEWHPDGPEQLAEGQGEREGVVDGQRLVWADEGEEVARRHRNGHILSLDGCMWRCLLCRHEFDAAVDADLFWCGDDCAGKHPGELDPGDQP